MTHCITIDYANGRARFDRSSYENQEEGRFSTISFLDGRPVVSLELAGIRGALILDTASNANWLFHPFQSEALLARGTQVAESAVAQCGLGDVNVRSSITIEDTFVGGAFVERLKFLLAGEADFGGPGHVSGCGILGTGQVASWHSSMQIIDFTTNHYYLR